MKEELADLFTKLIADRPGRFASMIVDTLIRPDRPAKLTFSLKVNDFTYWFAIVSANYRFVIESEVHNLFMQPEGGPVIDWPGVPMEWTHTMRFNLAKRIDAAFRGHADRFDSSIP